MQTLCQKCGTPAASDQAFCSRCGAVLGMAEDVGGGGSPDLAATMVGKKLPPTPPTPRPAPRPPAPRPPAVQRPVAPPPAAPAPAPTARGGNLLLVVIAVGFVLVLLVGTLLLLLYFLLSRG